MRFGFLLSLLVWAATAALASPSVEEIVRKLGANASDPAIEKARAEVVYARESRVDYLDDEQQVKKRVVRHYRIEPVDGRAVTRLITVNGKPATEKDQERPSQTRETGEKSRTLSLSEDLLGRYEFSLLGEETLEGRRAWMLRFRARAGVENDGFFDRLLNAMSGIIWVDAEESQLAKAEIYLTKKVSFFGGIAGAIERLDLTLVQRRWEPNVWLADSTFIDFSGRKLFSSIRFRCYEKCSDFRRPLQASTGFGGQ